MQAIQQAMKKALWAGLAAALVVVAGAQSAEAGSIRLTQGANVLTINDGGVGDANGAAGAINLIGTTLGVFRDITVSAFSQPISGSLANPDMVLNVSAESTAAGTLMVEFSDTNFAGTGTTVVANTQTLLGPAGSFQYDTLFDATNGLLAGGALVTSQGVNGFNIGAISSGVGPYSLTQRIILAHNAASPVFGGAGQNTNSTNTLSVQRGQDVPDGGSTAALLGSALMALGLVRRRFSKR